MNVCCSGASGSVTPHWQMSVKCKKRLRDEKKAKRRRIRCRCEVQGKLYYHYVNNTAPLKLLHSLYQPLHVHKTMQCNDIHFTLSASKMHGHKSMSYVCYKFASAFLFITFLVAPLIHSNTSVRTKKHRRCLHATYHCYLPDSERGKGEEREKKRGRETGKRERRERRNTAERICENKLFESLRASSAVSAVHDWLCGCADDMLLNASEQEMNVESQTQLDWETGEEGRGASNEYLRTRII